MRSRAPSFRTPCLGGPGGNGALQSLPSGYWSGASISSTGTGSGLGFTGEVLHTFFAWSKRKTNKQQRPDQTSLNNLSLSPKQCRAHGLPPARRAALRRSSGAGSGLSG